MIFQFCTILGVMELQLLTNQLFIFTLDSVTFGFQQKANIRKTETKTHVLFPGYLGGEVLLGGEGLSERTESMLDQVIQLTWGGGGEKVGTSVLNFSLLCCGDTNNDFKQIVNKVVLRDAFLKRPSSCFTSGLVGGV